MRRKKKAANDLKKRFAEIGDLVASSIKRFVKTKDFGSILPGHGGILDRFDSIIFVVLMYIFFLGII